MSRIFQDERDRFTVTEGKDSAGGDVVHLMRYDECNSKPTAITIPRRALRSVIYGLEALETGASAGVSA